MKKTLSLLAVLLAWIVPGAQAARIDTLAIESKYLPVPDSVMVITPQTADSQRMPSVYLLNGFTGCHKDWLRMRPDLPEIADRHGIVIVMPSGMDSWYWDSPADPTMRMESFFTQELVPYIDSRYPTAAEPSLRAIAGLSMGGHGALWLAMRHSDLWGNAGSMSGGVDIRPFPERWKMEKWLGPKEEFPARWDEYTVINLVPSLKPGQLNIIFDCGADDFFAGVNSDLHEALLRAEIPHDYISRPGAHNVPYWRDAVLYQLLFFNQKFDEARK